MSRLPPRSTRPYTLFPDMTLFRSKPVAVIGASPGGFGTQLGQNAWLPVLRTLGTAPWFEGRLMVSRAGQVFDGEGLVIDTAIEARLRTFVAAFCAHVDQASKRSEEQTSEIQSLMRITYAVFG